MPFPSFESPAAAAILDRINVGVVLADAEGQVIAANAAAMDYIRRGDGLMIEGGRLAAEIAHQSVKLRDRIRGAAEIHCTGAILLSRSQSPRRLQVTVTPLGAEDGSSLGALVTVYEPGRGGERLVEQIRTMFSLSKAEAEIAARIAFGDDLETIAATRKVSANTLRVQIASAMSKMGAHRQAQFGAAILGLDVFA